MSKKRILLLILIGIIACGTFAYATVVFASNSNCPDGKVCYWAVQKNHQFDFSCRHNQNDPWRFIMPLMRCDDLQGQLNFSQLYMPIMGADPNSTYPDWPSVCDVPAEWCDND